MLPRLPVLLLAIPVLALAQDPPARVGRISHVNGAVSFQPGGVDDWVPASINRPLTVGDQIYADTGGRAEIEVPGTIFRLNSQTAFDFLNLDDQQVQARLSEGAVAVRVRRLDENLEVDTPNLAFTITRPGEYRIETDPDNYQTYVTVRGGEGQITANGGTFSVEPGQQAVVNGQNGDQYNIYAAPGYDDFGNWVVSRNRREDSFQSARYVSPDVVGYQDLDQYGNWQNVPGYGECWTPRDVPAGWAPYHDGHWAWVDPWGWSWVDDAAWGFAPFHYGRWAHVSDRWAWVPGPPQVAPVYAPALVAWVGFGGGGAGIGVGVGPAVGWFPLGPRDVYIPAYNATPAYVNRVNVTNTTVINTTNVTNVYNTYVQTKTISTTNYVNRNVPGAVMAVPQTALVDARPVRQAAVRVEAPQLKAIRSAEPAPRVVPKAASVLGHQSGGHAARPPAAVLRRAVVAKATPPPPPPSFEQRQTELAKNPGHPVAIRQLRQAAQRAAPKTAAARPEVKVIAQAKPVKPTVSHTPAPKPKAATQAARPAQTPAATAQRQNRPPATQQRSRQAQPPKPEAPSQAQHQQVPARPPNAAERKAQPPQAQRPARPPSRLYEPPNAQQRHTPQPATPARPQQAQPQTRESRPPQRPAQPQTREARPAQPAPNGERNRSATPNRPANRPATPQRQESRTPPARQERKAAPPPAERKASPAPRREQKSPPSRKEEEKKKKE